MLNVFGEKNEGEIVVCLGRDITLYVYYQHIYRTLARYLSTATNIFSIQISHIYIILPK